MARYIDADRIVFWVRHVSSNGKLCDTDVRKVAFSDEIARIPTADVVPKSEVEKIFTEIESCIFEYGSNHIFSHDKFEEIKKKYRGGYVNANTESER